MNSFCWMGQTDLKVDLKVTSCKNDMDGDAILNI